MLVANSAEYTSKAPVARARAARCGPRHSLRSFLRSLRRRASPSRQRGATRHGQPAAPPPVTAHLRPPPHSNRTSRLPSLVDRSSLRSDRSTPSRVLLAAAEGGRSQARATAVSAEIEVRTLDPEFYINGRVNPPHTCRYYPTVLRFRTMRAKVLYRITINQWL